MKYFEGFTDTVSRIPKILKRTNVLTETGLRILSGIGLTNQNKIKIEPHGVFQS